MKHESKGLFGCQLAITTISPHFFCIVYVRATYLSLKLKIFLIGMFVVKPFELIRKIYANCKYMYLFLGKIVEINTLIIGMI